MPARLIDTVSSTQYVPTGHLKAILTLEMLVVELKLFERTLLYRFQMPYATFVRTLSFCVWSISQKFISVVLQNDTGCEGYLYSVSSRGE